MKYLVLFTIPVFLFSCSGETKTNNQTTEEVQSESSKPEFPWDERTAFVIYAGQTEDDEPDESYPSLIFAEYDADKNFMMADGVPILSALTETDMLEQLDSFESSATDSTETAIVIQLRTWVSDRIDEGYSAFLYELEPPEMAGKAYPLAKAAENQ